MLLSPTLTLYSGTNADHPVDPKRYSTGVSASSSEACRSPQTRPRSRRLTGRPDPVAASAPVPKLSLIHI